MLKRVVRIMHTQGAGQCAEGGLGTGWSMDAVGYIRLGWTGQSDGTEDGEDRRQRRRSVRADGVRTLWRGNTWRMVMRASTCGGVGPIQDEALMGS